MKAYRAILETIYDTYSPMLYSIALDISPTTKEAETILIKAFQQIHLQKLTLQNRSMLCISLIKILMQTARQEFYPGLEKNNFRLKHFENTPLLHQIFCEQSGLKNYCKQNKITTNEAMKQIRNECSVLQGSESVVNMNSL